MAKYTRKWVKTVRSTDKVKGGTGTVNLSDGDGSGSKKKNKKKRKNIKIWRSWKMKRNKKCGIIKSK